jgi:hypothetical protein
MTKSDYDEDEIITVPGGPPPRTPAPQRPIRLNYTDVEVEERLRRRKARIVRGDSGEANPARQNSY